jgi:hypothetical protein
MLFSLNLLQKAALASRMLFSLNPLEKTALAYLFHLELILEMFHLHLSRSLIISQDMVQQILNPNRLM